MSADVLRDAGVELVTISGRENLPIADRIGMLRGDLLTAPFLGIDDGTRSVSQAIHDLKVTIGAIRGTVELYDRARARGTPDERLEPGARVFISPIECQVLAWRRGGHLEWRRVRRLQSAIGAFGGSSIKDRS